MDQDKLLYSAFFDIRITHSETLMPALDNAMAICGFAPKDISELFVCCGPGSFTGLRIGIATAKGIAFGLNIPVNTYNSLQLSAFPCIDTGKNILCIIDAKMQEVYAAMYDSHLNEIHSPKAMKPEDILAWDLSGAILCGSGCHILKPLLQGRNICYASAYHNIPRAETMFFLPEIATPTTHDSNSISDLEPLYLRESTAQIKRDLGVET